MVRSKQVVSAFTNDMNHTPSQQLGTVATDGAATPPELTADSSLGLGFAIRSESTVPTPPTSPDQNRPTSDRCKDLHRPDGTSNNYELIQYWDSKPATNELSICPFDVKVMTDQRGGNQVFGHGAWSTVFKAVRQQAPSVLGMITPPSSPVTANPLLLAVKVPTRKDARAILEHEGRVLTYMSQISGYGEYVVHFYGLVPAYSSLVLAAIPLSLEDHIVLSANRAKLTMSTWSMGSPVTGNARSWLDLCHRVISALNWLHTTAGVVHGDIKPGNIMLRPSSKPTGATEFPFDPIFIDFSSSHVPHSGSTCMNSLSAVTREYTAPELLSSSVLRDPKSTATFASDVFSTAATLLVAATGDTKVYPGSSFQRQAMATQGWQVIQFARSGDQGSRIPRQGVVERTLERAVLRMGMGRVSASQWLDIVDDMKREEPAKAS